LSKFRKQLPVASSRVIDAAFGIALDLLCPVLRKPEITKRPAEAVAVSETGKYR
jgi:hypothetical protein